ncbi:T9SS type B sorting domain-containing protein [Winogradskyella immobilis]|uniref:T9SS type B sorting domain-containing protein n=1 Tax=Winogradskyella immobilis TaxID=2816852 RepID=A0ABS8EM49_9FLAO|nr:T9SS type B sorting domain-containing protein [Winogradskyella immobilis]MCC1484082.1 T9SS type B sorting domain-containing protein [Winogradskyella immobilis]MCG0016174.1 T9SS type B sorting domain-containing protein [Winogradskyella immobilis]
MKFNNFGIPSSLDDNTIPRNVFLGFVDGPNNLICANDDEGNLLFYSDGRIFKNRMQENMLNSPTDKFAFRGSQAAVARDPGNPNRYYVFVTTMEGLRNRLTYNIVDMSLNNGLGGLDPSIDHEVLLNNAGQHMVTARHANGRDIWLIAMRDGSYNAYLITENGISRTPVRSQEGLSFVDGSQTDFGVMEISPDNTLIAVGFPRLKKLFILRFNDLTGKLDLVYEEQDETGNLFPYFGIEFSPNSKVLYTTYLTEGIRQYDIADLNNIPDPINLTPSPSSVYPYLKRGPDGKIYSVQRGLPFIGAIRDPNIIGFDSDYSSNVLDLSGANLLDLPTFLLPKRPIGISFVNICEGETTEINYGISSSFSQNSYQWDLGDGNTITTDSENILHTYLNPGTYTVSVKVIVNFLDNELIFTDSKEITIFETPNIIELDDVFLCSEDTTVFLIDYDEEVLNGLDPDIFRVTYYTTEQNALLKNDPIIDLVPDIGTVTIWVRVENAVSPTCFDISSFNITTPEFITIDIPTEQFICDVKDGLILSAPDGFISYEWSTGETTQDITVMATGRYILTVVQDFGTFTCEAQTTIFVSLGDNPPIIEDIKVIDWSQNHNSIEVILAENGDYEYSVDGINYQTSPIFLDLPIDDYRVYVRDINCLREVVSDTLFLLYHDRFFTPNGDGVNDYWRVINSNREENIEISIFDRYGKLLTTFDFKDRGWDGTFNGQPMPTSDYWFRVVRNNGNVHYGHFTLKR